jgi:AcrR family transcriptional regulator
MTTRVYSSSRDRILHAAEDIILKDGASHLTLDAVAKAAGLSKGGLMYHFPTKESLIEGLMKRVHIFWMNALQQSLDTTRPGPARMARSMVRCCLSNEKDATRHRHERVFFALAAAKMYQPELFRPIQDSYRAILKEFHNDPQTLGRSLMVMAALDGLWWSDAFETYQLNSAQRDLIRTEMEALLLGCPETAPKKPSTRRKTLKK